MHANFKILAKTVLTVLLIGLIAACAKPYYLSVGYHLPEEPRLLAGQKVSLAINDQREDKSIFCFWIWAVHNKLLFVVNCILSKREKKW